MTTLLGAHLLIVNAVAAGAFAIDKSAAATGRWRIKESTLLFIALAGGSLGALIAQQALRHKTRKQPFRAVLIAIAVLHFGLSVWLISRSFA
jgi:uncharacterized membrane protein YsdA (DUF1294 family)